MPMAELRLVKDAQVSRRAAAQLVRTFISLSRAQLAGVIADGDRTGFERSVAAAVAKAIADGDYTAVDATVENLLRLCGREAPSPKQEPAPSGPERRTPPLPAKRALDFDALRQALAEGTF